MLSLKDMCEAIAEVCRGAGCVYALLFGSYARGDVKDYSDVDIAVMFSGAGDPLKRAANLAYELEELLRRSVDVVPLNVVDSIVKYEAYSQGVLLYCSNRARYLDDMVNAIDEYLDFKPHFESFYRRAVEGIRSAVPGGEGQDRQVLESNQKA